ncbi:hypothetical protein Moror_14979 [Moniliophthora roreri MCA 2997]|uniref:Uncharacterized protein n=1 Tax=Moniliophthora roreri (strain MCA 2997) TaxID=1381753 RepID=V2WRN6_MONRO|nr:hypothetical protein Moror_14979 [Moniliophthora roreri MCA 2997]
MSAALIGQFPLPCPTAAGANSFLPLIAPTCQLFNLAEIFEWFSVLTAVHIGEGQNPTDAYNLIQTCLVKLKEEQIEIADWMISMILMKALPGSWDTFKSQVFITVEKKEDFAVSTLYFSIQREWSRRNLSPNMALISRITGIRPAQGYQAFQKQNNRPFRLHGGNQSSGNQTYRYLNSRNQSNASYKQGGNNQQQKSSDQKKKPSNQKSNQTKKSYKGKKQNTFVAAFDEGEDVVNMAFATAIDEEGGTSDEAEDSEMETQMEHSDQYSQTSEEEDTPYVKTLSLASGRHSSAPLHQQSIAYETDDGELISEQEVENSFRSDNRFSSPITGNNNDKESLGEEDTDDEDDELESSDESFHTVPQGDEDKENTPPEPVEAVTPPMNSTSYFPQSNPPSHLETNIYCGSGPTTLVPSFPDPSVPNNFNLHALRGYHLIPLTHSTPRIIVPNPLFTWINSLDKFLAQFPDKFVKLGMIKMQYIINRARQEGLLDEPCIQTYLEMMYLAICKPMVYGHL